MIKEREYHKDEKTVLLDYQGQIPARGPLTDSIEPPRFEQLEERMIYAARLRSGETFNVSLNPLMATAFELLPEVIRSEHSTVLEGLAALKGRLTSAMKLFEFRAVRDSMENNQVMVAHHVLCMVVSEAVVTTPWGNESEWSKINLPSNFYNETFSGEKFSQLSDRSSKNLVERLPMLELTYLCLTFGLEGKHRVMTRGMPDLDGTSDAPYRQIRQLHGDVLRELSPYWQELSGQRRGPVRIAP